MVAITSAGASSRSVVSDSAISAKDTKGTKNTQVRMHRKPRVRVSDASTGAAGRDVDLSAPIAPSIQSPLLMRVRFEQVTKRFGRHVAADAIALDVAAGDVSCWWVRPAAARRHW